MIPSERLSSVAMPPTPTAEPRRRGFWSVLISSQVLVVSLLLHVIGGIGATYVVVQHLEAKRKVAFVGHTSPSAPSERRLLHKVSVARQQRTMSAPAQAKRIASTKLSAVNLPEMPSLPTVDNTFMAGKMSGMGGNALALGPAGGMGAGGGGGGGGNMFGFKTKQGAALVGRLYDLKQFKNRSPTGMDKFKYTEIVYSFIRGSWSPNSLGEYYQAESPLYATQIMTPQMAADEGPKAFGVDKEVEPKMWLVHYSGRVTPPQSGRYYFVGAGDDVMIVRFNGQIVLDRGWESQLQNRSPACRATAEYNYGRIALPNGFARGISFEVRSGQYYNIDILIGEQPGGLFSASLLYEKEGETYQKDANGNPILPIFRTATKSALKVSQEQACAPFQENGPIWAAQSTNPGIGNMSQ